MIKLVTAAMVVLLPTPSAAATAKHVCSFPNFHSFDENQMQTVSDFSVAFSYDTLTNDAFIEGNNGLSPVTLIRGQNGLTFLEILSTGAVQSTTISLNGSAVHSRHSIISGDLVPSQYYGECK